MFDINKILNDLSSTLNDCFLRNVTNISNLNDNKIEQVFKTMYSHSNSNLKRMATILNSIVTHQTTTFMFTFSSAQELFREDNKAGNTKYESINSREFKTLKRIMFDSGYFKEVEKQVGR